MSQPKFPEVALGEVVRVDRRIVSPDEIQSGTLYVGLENVQGDGSFLDVGPVANGDLASSKFCFTPGHVLYGKLRPYLRKIAMPEFVGICSTDILPLMPGHRVDRNYLYHYLRQDSMIGLATSRSRGDLPRLSPNALLEFPITVPPLDEQRRIAAILDQADALRAKRRQAREKAGMLKQSVFLEMWLVWGISGWIQAR